jgi:hypothetical protein
MKLGAGMVGTVELHEAALGGNDASFNRLCRTIITVGTKRINA